MTYTKEQKKVYFNSLREKWQANKLASEQDVNARAKWEAINKESGQGVSYSGFYFTYQQMQSQGLDGVPYVDAKTFQGWKKAGFQVKKGQKSTLQGISWVEIKDKPEDEGYLLPKEYHLFHKSQVEPII